jgi:hypothetical protein
VVEGRESEGQCLVQGRSQQSLTEPVMGQRTMLARNTAGVCRAAMALCADIGTGRPQAESTQREARSNLGTIVEVHTHKAWRPASSRPQTMHAARRHVESHMSCHPRRPSCTLPLPMQAREEHHYDGSQQLRSGVFPATRVWGQLCRTLIDLRATPGVA